MPRDTGPTIPRWRLSAELKELRQQAGVTLGEVAKVLDCSDSKIKKIESGDVGVIRSELKELLDLYQITDETLRESLFELQKLGKQRGWWVQFGSLQKQFTTFLGLESEATRVRIFEPTLVPGLLQTEEYARAVDAMFTFATPAERDRTVQIRMARQKTFWESEDNPSRLWAIMDEAALHRVVGDRDTMKAQLMHLLDLTSQCTLQVVPFDVGGYAGTLGPLSIFDFEEEVHSPVVYVDGQAGILLLEKSPEVERANLVFSHVAAVALNPNESARKVMAIAKEVA